MNKIHGFTLIEMLFVFQIICIFQFFLIPYHSFSQDTIIIQQIYHIIENARFAAIYNNENQKILFTSHEIFTNNYLVYEHQSLLFDEDSITFNPLGHLQKAKTIEFSIKNTQYKLIFNLGQGAYRIEKA